MAGIKKQKFSLDGLNEIMSGVASEEKLPDVRPIELNMLYVGPQPRQILGLIENLGQNPSDDAWVIPITDLLKHLREAAAENRNLWQVPVCQNWNKWLRVYVNMGFYNPFL